VDSNFGTFLSLYYFDKRRVILRIFVSTTHSISLLSLGIIVQYLFDRVHDKAEIKLLPAGILLTFILILFNLI